MRTKLYILFATFLLSLVIYGFFNFISEAHNIVGIAGNDEKVDVIVVLTGGDGRIDTAVRLFQEGYGKKLVLSGVNESATLKSILGSKFESLDTSNILIDRKSKNTVENAIETKRIIEDSNIKSIMIVTSKFHMVRSKYLFSNYGTDGVKYSYYPVDGGEGLTAKFSEFVKYYYYYLGDNLKAIFN